MLLPEGLAQEAEVRKARAADDAAGVDVDLFETLKALRRRLAGEEGIPAYIVFSDAALRDMCRRLPVNPEDFLKVNGVGKAKLQKYGDEFIGAIREFTEKQDETAV
jgi:ATP-dependent DNA helicase RecQ